MEPGETISLDNRQVTFCATNFSYALASQITGVSLYDRNGDMEDATYVQALERANLLSFILKIIFPVIMHRPVWLLLEEEKKIWIS